MGAVLAALCTRADLPFLARLPAHPLALCAAQDRETMTFAEFVYHPNLYQVYESHDDYSPSAPSLIDEFAEWQQSQ